MCAYVHVRARARVCRQPCCEAPAALGQQQQRGTAAGSSVSHCSMQPGRHRVGQTQHEDDAEPRRPFVGFKKSRREGVGRHLGSERSSLGSNSAGSEVREPAACPWQQAGSEAMQQPP